MPAIDPATQTDARRISGVVLSALGVAAITLSTLRPHPATHAFLAASCCSFSDVVLNVLLFIPLGAGLVMLGLRPLAAVVTGALVSSGIEVAQYWWIEGRFASVADVGANVAGALLGVLMVVHWHRRARWWPKVAPAVAVLVVLVWLLGAQVVRPAIPGPAEWVVEWGHAADRLHPFGGKLVEASLQGVPLSPGRVMNQPALRALLSASDTTSLSATIVTGPASPEAQQLLEIKVGEGNEPFMILRQEGQTLRAYQRLELIWVGLSSPWVAVRDAIPTTVGDTVRIRLTGTGQHLRLVAIRGDGRRESSLTLSPDLYLSALFYRITDGAVWWGLVPSMISFLLLGLALATSPKILVVAASMALFLSANRAGCSYPEWPVVLVTMLGAWAGWRAGRLMELFPRVE
jgi:VanZ family protein